MTLHNLLINYFMSYANVSYGTTDLYEKVVKY